MTAGRETRTLATETATPAPAQADLRTMPAVAKPLVAPAAPPAALPPKPAPAAGDTADDEGGPPMTFWEHLDELRKRIVWSVIAFFVCCFLAWEVKEEVMNYLSIPFYQAWAAQNLPGKAELHFDAPGSIFTAYFKLSMIVGVGMASPVIFYQLWSFVAPGLYAKEKKFVIPFVLSSSLLFVGGGYFGYKTAFPIMFNYFLGLSGNIGSLSITPMVMMSPYIDFVSQLLLCFGLIFEIPLFLLFLSLAGIINYLHLIRFGRWFILVAFVVAAIITPPDATSQLLMAVPMCLLYAVSIGLAFLFGKKPTEAQREAFRNRKKKKTPEPDAT
ncbi:MAG: twin-arginine translocase subunit TatC [Polyangiaceae bacterium]